MSPNVSVVVAVIRSPPFAVPGSELPVSNDPGCTLMLPRYRFPSPFPDGLHEGLA